MQQCYVCCIQACSWEAWKAVDTRPTLQNALGSSLAPQLVCVCVCAHMGPLKSMEVCHPPFGVGSAERGVALDMAVHMCHHLSLMTSALKLAAQTQGPNRRAQHLP